VRVLVYRALGLGDFLTAVPAYRAVRRAFPSYEVVLAAPEPLRPLVPLTGALDALLPTAPLATPAWPGEPPDVAVNLHGRGPQSHAAVAAALSAEGHDVVVTGVAGEAELARSVARGAGLPDDAVLAGRLDLGQLAALVADAWLVLCGDTGVAHLATAYGTPSVALFGPMSPALWGPPPDRPQHQVLWRPELAGVDGGAGGPHPSLLAIGVDEVLDRARAVASAA